MKDKFVDIVGMSKYATERQKVNKNAINGTLGILKNDNNELYVYNVVDEIIRNIPSEDLYDYPSIDGGVMFKENIMRWIFQDYYEDITKKFDYTCMATPGSVLGIVATLRLTTDINEQVIVQSVRWPNYDGMLQHALVTLTPFEMFDGNNFNLKGFINVSEEILKTNKRLVVLINDPSHNSSGYSMTTAEWNGLIEYINSLKSRKKEVIFIYDIAYIDYSFDDYFKSRDNLSLITGFDDHVLISVCYSGSKTFSVYGLRMGAQIFLSKNKKKIKDLSPMAPFFGRSIWSVPASPGIALINTLYSDKRLKERFLKELFTARDILKQRKDIFLSEAKESGLIHYPKSDGFFVTIPFPDSALLREELLKKDIHVVPQGKSIRVALSNIPTRLIFNLAKEIKISMDKISEK